MASEIITLGADGGIGSEMRGFEGNACLKAAAEVAAELERLGVVTDVSGITMKDTTAATTAQQSAMKVTEGG